ncbi:Flp pilus assembly protein CpaB [Bordetella genomosp. 7]|uniref:Flp pilus assembly protein CpaB n=1 Tax=Bordetella genomosp. 7 TaxID=1416805 RepID=UPI000B9E71D6|nr:Flp pilus assembly protein CpaB [Bordetella genomosp. 7]OZI24258.1 Flp pilus assembly protein CpaB [Bordetella genomosp. 7]
MKPALREHLGRLRAVGVYGFALIAGLLAAWAAQEHIQARVREIEREAEVATAERLVAAVDLPAGTRLLSAHLAVRGIPLPWLASGSFDADAADYVIGSILSTDIKQGETILEAHLGADIPEPPLSDLVPAGRRAVTLPAEEINAAPGVLRPGDLIDLYVSFAHRGQQLTASLLQGVRVLAMNDAADAAATITLDASAQDAVKLVAARHGGTLTAMLRHRGDLDAWQPPASGNLAGLMGIDTKVAGARPAVSILYGDRLDIEAGLPHSDDDTGVEPAGRVLP